jgi:hypothetical protein
VVLLLPVAVAVESKHTVADAYEKIGQLIDYSLNDMYDAVVLRLEEAPRSSEELKKLADVVDRYGIGVVVGGEPYSPLSGAEEVLRRALLTLRANPLKLLEDMGLSARSISASLDTLLTLRRYFTVSGHEL